MHCFINCVRSTYSFNSRHLNVAKFVGVTPGYNGPNGAVVAMGEPPSSLSVGPILLLIMMFLDGMDIDQFLLRTHSGAVWAECVSCLSILFEYD